MDAATLWRMRVTWALVGAMVTLAIIAWRDRGSGTAEPSAVASVDAEQEAPPAITPLAEPSIPTFATPPVEATPPAPPAINGTDDTVERSPSEPPTANVGPAIDPLASAPTTTAPAAPFELPLPLMPGARIMKRSQRPDAEHGGVIVTLALSVPAPGMQVESFYRAALVDAKLAVSGGSTEPGTMGTGHHGSLRGRSRDARVNVNLRQPAGKLRTIVRIIWQTLP